MVKEVDQQTLDMTSIVILISHDHQVAVSELGSIIISSTKCQTAFKNDDNKSESTELTG